MSQVRYLQTYRENKVQTADPGTILLLLYQGAIDFLKKAISALEKEDVVEKGMCILKAHAIISELQATLKMDIGGEMATNLQDLYSYILDQIMIANHKNDPALLESLISLLSTVKEGFEGAIQAEKGQGQAIGAAP